MDSDNNQSDTEDANPEIRKSHFLFRRTHEVAVRNRKILTAFNVDVGAAIAAQTHSPVTYG